MLDRARVREVFAGAAELPECDRAEFLDRACAGDATLRAEVFSLLEAASRRPGFFSSPTTGGDGISPAEPIGTQIGPYKLLKEIGRGGFGTVYLAEQDAPVRRQVALKIIKLGMDTRAVIARFESERQALAVMDHAHIAKVLDAGATTTGRPYFVMELVRGDPITVYADRAGLTIAERLDVFVQVCHAVQHAHTKGIIHRDIKPGNVLVTAQDGRPHARVIDFGIAKATEQRLTERTRCTEFQQLIGTPEYMSPEQAGGAPDVDTRSDVYSLGVLLYELLTGATPFDPKELRSAAYGEIQRIIREVEPPKPSTRLSRLESLASVAAQRRTEPARLGVQLSGELDWIVMKAMEKDRGRRYESPGAFAEEVRRHLAGEPVSAAPPSRGYRARKFIRRNRAAVLAGCMIAGALVLGTIGTALGMRKARIEQRRAEDQRAIANREAEQARAINDFMRHVLTSVEPQNRGADVRLMDVLAEASASASDRFAAHPLLEAQVRELFGASYFRLTLWEKSAVEFQRAQALYETNAGRDDPRTLGAEARSLHAAVNSGHARQAEPAMLALLPRVVRVLGADDRLTLEVHRVMADVHTKRGRTAEAESILLALRSHPRLADDDAAQVRVLHALFRAYHMRPAAEDREQELAFWGGVVPMAGECVVRAARASGADSLLALQSQNHLSNILYKHEEFAAAADASRAVLARSNERMGECHNVRYTAIGGLGSALARLGEVGEAADLQLRSIKCLRESSPNDTIMLVSAMAEALHFLDRTDRAAEGEALARESAALLAKFGVHVSAFRSELFIAGFVSMAGRVGEAESLFQPLREQAEASGKTFAQACVELAYARHLTRLGRFEESERCLERCVGLRDLRLGTYDGLPDDIVFAYIELYQAWNKPEKVREYEAIRRETFGIAPRPTP